jgi:hypothetical protein
MMKLLIACKDVVGSIQSFIHSFKSYKGGKINE